SIFVTGRAGTGKSTLLSYFNRTTRKKIVVLAPTGVAALNVRGQTIHSFFRFKPNITLEKVRRLRSRDKDSGIYRKLDAVVIDEISMVRADLLDCVDKFLRLNGPEADLSFGGVQMIFIGDLYQLPPVVTSSEKQLFASLYESPYFYSANVFNSFEMEFVELEKVYRQQDQEFIRLLNSIRNKSVDEAGLVALNRRYLPQFEPPPGDFYIYLTTTNALAEEINNRRLAQLKSSPHTFTAYIEGDFGNEYLPTAVNLQVKTGAQVMMLNNDSLGRWVNGSIGEITAVEWDRSIDQHIITVELSDGETVEVTPFTWEIFSYFVEGAQLKSEVVGKFTQYPLMLAWAVTIHKSQGKTFSKVIIDFGRGTFAHGQAYVALSRCTSLEGMVLKKPLVKHHILMDYDVVKFLTRYQYQKAEQANPADDKRTAIEKAISNKSALQIVYLKPNDEKSKRIILPESVGEMEYQGKTYLGVRAFCLTRNEERNFRIDRILKMEEVTDIR
ncbi:MAG: AAA family ATPase, partial [Dehalococcoidia bacterium]|nr:AAA family ATPase [Dehalococcoidia bacterium]